MSLFAGRRRVPRFLRGAFAVGRSDKQITGSGGFARCKLRPTLPLGTGGLAARFGVGGALLVVRYALISELDEVSPGSSRIAPSSRVGKRVSGTAYTGNGNPVIKARRSAKDDGVAKSE